MIRIKERMIKKKLQKRKMNKGKLQKKMKKKKLPLLARKENLFGKPNAGNCADRKENLFKQDQKVY